MIRIRRPLCWMAAFYALGLLCGGRVSCPYGVGMAACALAALICLLSARRAWLWLSLAFLCLGGMRMQGAYEAVVMPPEEKTELTAQVVDRLLVDEEQGIALVLVQNAQTPDGTPLAPGRRIRLRVQLREEETWRIPGVGGTIRVQEARLYAPRGRRNPGGFDQQAYDYSRNIALRASAGDDWRYTPPRGVTFYGLLTDIREAALEKADALFTYAAPLYRGMLLGDRQAIDGETYADLKYGGIAHLLAVSGLHVSAVMGFCLWIIRRRQWPLRRSMLCAIALVWGYGLLTGLGASVMRACAMGTMLLLARMLHERYDSPSALAAAFLLLAGANPWRVLDTGFVLSFAAVGGILLTLPAFERLFLRLHAPKRLRGALAITFSAQAACIPFQALYFGSLPVAGVLVNLLCVPLATVLVTGGMLEMALGFVCMPLAQWIAPVFRIGVSLMQGLAAAASNISFSNVRVPAPSGVIIAAYYAVCFLLSPYFARRLRVRCACIGTVAALCVGHALLTASPPATRYVQLDVGQGDCAVAQTARGTVCAIDTGPLGSGEMTGYLHHEGLAVDLLVLSHLDADHAGGLIALANARIPVGCIALPYGIEPAHTNAQVLKALDALAARGSELVFCAAGDMLSLPDMSVQILAPAHGQDGGSNERSLVTRLSVDGVTLLSMGDAPEKSEPLRGVECDVIKIAHHGSATGTSALLLDRAQPSLALISVGRNAFGHPDGRVLARIKDAGVPVLRTDECGAITLTISEGGYHAGTFLTGE